MANKTSKKGKSKKGRMARKARGLMTKVGYIAKGFLGLDDSAKKAAMMLADPCNAALGPACFRGDQGFKSRFVSNGTGLSAGTTVAGAVALIPSSGQLLTIDWPAALTPTPWADNTVTYGPGRNFLFNNADGVRSLGACLSFAPLSANLSTSGVVYSGITSVASLGLTSNWTPPALAQLLPNFGKVTIDAPMECKFVPAGADEDYTTLGTPGDQSDNNAILFVFIGLPAGSGMSLRATNIVEWKPKPNIGIASNSMLGNPSKNTVEHVKEFLRARDEHWYTNVGKTAFSVIRGYSVGGAIGAAGAAAKVFS